MQVTFLFLLIHTFQIFFIWIFHLDATCAFFSVYPLRTLLYITQFFNLIIFYNFLIIFCQKRMLFMLLSRNFVAESWLMYFCVSRNSDSAAFISFSFPQI